MLIKGLKRGEKINGGTNSIRVKVDTFPSKIFSLVKLDGHWSQEDYSNVS